MNLMRSLLLLPLLTLAVSCKVPNMIFEPRPDEPLDGYAGGLTQAGVNTEIDWGPKQQLLMSRYQVLTEEVAQLQKSLEKQDAENRNLLAQVTQANKALTDEQSLRVQIEAQVQRLRNERRDLQAQVLNLGIEKAKLEQSNLLAKIARLQQVLDQRQAESGTAASPAGGSR